MVQIQLPPDLGYSFKIMYGIKLERI